jgi:hypothetical protein
MADFERLCKEKIKDGNNSKLVMQCYAGIAEKGNVFQSKVDEHLISSASKCKQIKTQKQFDNLILVNILQLNLKDELDDDSKSTIILFLIQNVRITSSQIFCHF